ncbi:zinc finger protein 362b isoform X2 [Electrophorus electricus]|uniref:zinc finger protein 362b isoform X2 n=1 Tax=Electrophorus electricus TaxID=8005 RepID=UPI000F09ACC2|nr:zinc finger protein 362b isoform X2 [Electrophorus electricus]
MAEPRFNNPYFWPPPPSMPGQQTLLVASPPSDAGQHVMSIPKLQQVPGLQAHNSQPDIALHARPASSTVADLNMDDKSAVKAKGLWEDWHMRQAVDQAARVNHRSDLGLKMYHDSFCKFLTANIRQPNLNTPNIKKNYETQPCSSSSTPGLTPSSRADTHSTSEAMTPTTPTSSSQNRLGGAPSLNVISGLANGPGMDQVKSGSLAGMLGPQPKAPRGRKKIKAENSTGPLLVVPYPILASGPDQSVTIAKEGKTYRCKVCPLTFFNKSEMQIHSKSHTEAKAHKCPHCSKTFANASYLAQHLRIHLGIKPYHCSYCENSFRQLSHLQQHTRIHTGDRPYKCAHPGCEKAFTQLSNLQSHQRQHNKDKPYKCPNCYRAYTDSASLQIHLSAHAVKNAKAYCCSMCGRAYTSETYLMKHMSKHTVVEHLVSHHSPQRTESPSIPIRVSLI